MEDNIKVAFVIEPDDGIVLRPYVPRRGAVPVSH